MGHNLCLHFGADEHPCATYFDVHQGYRVLGQNETTRPAQVLVHVSIYRSGKPFWGYPIFDHHRQMAVAQKTDTPTGTLISGMDQNLRNPSCLILSHTHMNFGWNPQSGWNPSSLILSHSQISTFGVSVVQARSSVFSTMLFSHSEAMVQERTGLFLTGGKHVAVAQKHVLKWHLGKWNQRLKPAVCPSS